MKKRRYIARLVTKYNDAHSIEKKTLYDNHGNVAAVTHYDSEGRPLNGICGDFMTWHMEDPQTIVIRGSGYMDDFSYYTPAPWQMHRITTVIIEDGVESIGANAFVSHYTNMRVNSVRFPESLQRIAIGAFDGSDLPAEVFDPDKLVFVTLF